MLFVDGYDQKQLAEKGHLPTAVSLYCQNHNITKPRVSDLFKAMQTYIPWFSSDGNPVIEELEGGEGPKAYPGGIPLQEHDLMHWIMGQNLVIWDAGNSESKTGEGFLTGFQFAADPEFTRNHKKAFTDDMRILADAETIGKDYIYEGVRAAAYHAGFEVGRYWHKETGKNLRMTLKSYIESDAYLDEVIDKFYGDKEVENKIRRQIDLRLQDVRDGIPETFNPRNVEFSLT